LGKRLDKTLREITPYNPVNGYVRAFLSYTALILNAAYTKQ